MQAISLGQLASLEDARSVVRASFTPEIYQPGQQDGWDKSYATLQKVTK
jgi:hypothetical protein